MAVELLLGVGLAVSKMLLRAADESDAADALDDAREGWAVLRGFRRQETALGRLITDELQRQLGGISAEIEGDLRAAAQDVADLLSHLAGDEHAVIAAATYPDQFLDYAKKHGGDQKRRLISEPATLAFDRVLEAASAEFTRLVPSSSRFVPMALTDIVRQLPTIAEDARVAVHYSRRAADGVDRLVRGQDRDVVDASRAATDAGTRLGRPVPDWEPTKLGVHATIVVDGVTGLTPYILRSHDTKLRQTLAQLRQPGARPRLVTVVGTSCTGKTRTLYEAVNQVLPDWTLVKPLDIDELTRILQAGIPGHTVVWLDELQNFLTIHGVDAARAIRQLLHDTNSPSIAFSATIWPTNLTILEQRPNPADAQTGLGEISNLLRDTAADRHEVPDSLDRDELVAVSRDDPRVAKAIEHAADGQLMQVLAGGTQLVHRVYPDQRHIGDVFSPAARAVTLAAADLRRIGYPNPLPRWAIAGAAPGYIAPSDQRHLNPTSWIQNALNEATQDASHHHSHRLDIHQRGVPALTRVWLNDAITDMEYYELHDYLIQHHLIAHRHAPTTANMWSTLTAPSNVAQLAPHIATELGMDAQLRGLYSETISLFTVAADKGDTDAEVRLAGLLLKRGDEEGLQARADKGDRSAAQRLAYLLADRRDEEGLRARADKGEERAQSELARLLTERGDEEGLRARADKGEGPAQSELARLLMERGDEEGLRARADKGEGPARSEHARLLWHRSDEEGLRARADNGDLSAALDLASLLGNRGDEEGLRALADKGDFSAAHWLASLLANRGDEEGLRARADKGDSSAARMLTSLLAKRGDEEGLRTLAEKSEVARYELVHLLSKRAYEEDLRARADKGEVQAQSQLAGLLAARGDENGLRARAQKGDPFAAHRLAGLLSERDQERLRARADIGEDHARIELAILLAERGDEEGLRARADKGDFSAGRSLVHLLADRRDEEGLRARADQGDHFAALMLASLLAERDDEEGLRARAEESEDAQYRLVGLLTNRAAVNELRELVHATYRGAAEELITLYERDQPDSSHLELDVNAQPRPIMQPHPQQQCS